MQCTEPTVKFGEAIDAHPLMGRSQSLQDQYFNVQNIHSLFSENYD